MNVDFMNKEMLRSEYDDTIVILDQLDDKIYELIEERSQYIEKLKDLEKRLGEDL